MEIVRVPQIVIAFDGVVQSSSPVVQYEHIEVRYEISPLLSIEQI